MPVDRGWAGLGPSMARRGARRYEKHYAGDSVVSRNSPVGVAPASTSAAPTPASAVV
jgi:hypothetical protein